MRKWLQSALHAIKTRGKDTVKTQTEVRPDGLTDHQLEKLREEATQQWIKDFTGDQPMCPEHQAVSKGIIRDEQCQTCNVATCYICSNDHITRTACEVSSQLNSNN